MLAHLDGAARAAVPAASIAALLLISLVPWVGDRAAPALAIAAVHYWAGRRPDLVPAPFVFAVGLMHDSIADTPFGLMALVYLFVLGAARSQRFLVVGQPFVAGWTVFAVVAFAASAIAWAGASLYYDAALSVGGPGAVLLLTVLAYPAVAGALAMLDAAALKRTA